jgi:riboflavin biosynthesis pyrimidine reductase
VRQLLPVVEDDVDPGALVASESRPAPEGRPWVLVNMIATVDGATAIDGRSGALGGPADQAMFAAVRSIADVILVGAATVRVERYGPPSSGRLAIVTRSADVPAIAGHRPIVITTEQSDVSHLHDVADVVVAGASAVDLGLALSHLAAEVVVCEGGPRINAQLFAAGLVDEVRLTLAPLVVAGASPRVTNGSGLEQLCGLALDGVVEGDGFLFLRYLRSAR